MLHILKGYPIPQRIVKQSYYYVGQFASLPDQEASLSS